MSTAPTLPELKRLQVKLHDLTERKDPIQFFIYGECLYLLSKGDVTPWESDPKHIPTPSDMVIPLGANIELVAVSDYAIRLVNYGERE